MLPHPRRGFLCAMLSAISISFTGCGNAEVGSIQAGPDGGEPSKSKTEGRFKESAPPRPARGKTAKGKPDTADEGVETR